MTGNISSRFALLVRSRLFVAALALSLGIVACADPVAATSAAPSSVAFTSEVVELAGVGQLAETFNAGDPDTPRLILLPSPT